MVDIENYFSKIVRIFSKSFNERTHFYKTRISKQLNDEYIFKINIKINNTKYKIVIIFLEKKIQFFLRF